MQIVFLIRRTVVVLLEQLRLMALVLGRGHAQPDRQRLLVNHGAGDRAGPCKVGRRGMFYDGIQAVLQGPGGQLHGEQLIDAVHDIVAVGLQAIIQHIFVNALQCAPSINLMRNAHGGWQVFQQTQALDRMFQASRYGFAQGVNRGKSLMSAPGRPEQRPAGALWV